MINFVYATHATLHEFGVVLSQNMWAYTTKREDNFTSSGCKCVLYYTNVFYIYKCVRYIQMCSIYTNVLYIYKFVNHSIEYKISVDCDESYIIYTTMAPVLIALRHIYVYALLLQVCPLQLWAVLMIPPRTKEHGSSRYKSYMLLHYIILTDGAEHKLLLILLKKLWWPAFIQEQWIDSLDIFYADFCTL